jgi:hypothetical protein
MGEQKRPRRKNMTNREQKRTGRSRRTSMERERRGTNRRTQKVIGGHKREQDEQCRRANEV